LQNTKGRQPLLKLSLENMVSIGAGTRSQVRRMAAVILEKYKIGKNVKSFKKTIRLHAHFWIVCT
jgi:hypothetical protein